jgi:hypothetical protein
MPGKQSLCWGTKYEKELATWNFFCCLRIMIMDDGSKMYIIMLQSWNFNLFCNVWAEYNLYMYTLISWNELRYLFPCDQLQSGNAEVVQYCSDLVAITFSSRFVFVFVLKKKLVAYLKGNMNFSEYKRKISSSSL